MPIRLLDTVKPIGYSNLDMQYFTATTSQNGLVALVYAGLSSKKAHNLAEKGFKITESEINQVQFSRLNRCFFGLSDAFLLADMVGEILNQPI